MKTIRLLGALLLGLCIAVSSCGTGNDDTNRSAGSGSASQTTPNDSSGATSRSTSGVGEDNQDDSLGYPSNQSNLNAYSTSRKHDVKVPE